MKLITKLFITWVIMSFFLLQVTLLNAQVSGTKTIPGAYATIGAALADIQSSGLSGHVILELQQNYNWQNEVYPIVVPENFPTAANATVTIRPRIGAIDIHIGTDFLGGVVPPTGDIPIFDIYGSWFNIDGRPAGGGTISQLFIWSNAAEGTAVQLSNNASNNKISYCHLKGVNNYPSGFINGVFRKGVVTFNPAGPFPVGVLGGIHDNTIDHNIIEGDIRPGGTSTFVASPLYGIFANGNPDAPNINNKILDNQILNFTFSGIEIKPDGPGAGWIIKGNSFYSTLPNYYPEYAIDIFHTGYRSGTNIIEGNYIGGNAAFAAGKWQGGPFFGITCGTYDGGDSVSVRNNVIKNMEKINPIPYPNFDPQYNNSDAFAPIAIVNNYGSNKVYCSNNLIGGDAGDFGISISAPATGGDAAFWGLTYNNCSSGAITQNTIQNIRVSSLESSTFYGIRAFVINNVTIADNIIQQADVQSTGSVSVNNIFITDDHHEVPPCETGTQPITLDNNTMKSITATADGSADLTGVKINSRLASNAGNKIGSATEANSIVVTGNTATINGVLINGEPESVSISNDIIANITANGVNGSVVNGVNFNGTGTVKISGNDIKNLNAATVRGIFIEPLGGTSSATVEGNSVKGVSTSYGTGVEVNIPSTSTTNFVATNNTINAWQTGFLVTSASGSTLTQTAQGNFVTGNQTGCINTSSSPQNATCNWWGSASGPSGAGPGTGDPVGSNVIFSPWAIIPTFVAVNAGADQTIYLGYGSTSKTLTSTVTVCGPPSYLWSTGATSTSIIVSPVITTIYSLVVTDANGHSASDSVTVTVKDVRCDKNKVKVCHKDIKTNKRQTLCVATSDVAIHLAHGDALGECTLTATRIFEQQITDVKDFDIYPNPVTGAIQLRWNSTENGTASIKIVDALGRILIQQNVTETRGSNSRQLSMAQIANGNYIFILNQKGKIKTTRLLVKH